MVEQSDELVHFLFSATAGILFLLFQKHIDLYTLILAPPCIEKRMWSGCL